MALALIPDEGLAALYLRRLGFSDAEAADMVSARPLSKVTNKTLLNDLIGRHVLRIPFTNLEAKEERVARHGSGGVRQVVERICGMGGGGISLDLNPAFAWLLTKLGAAARLAMAWPWVGEEYSGSCPSHVVVIVDLPEGPVLVDPGSGDPIRAALSIQGESADSLASYEVVSREIAEGPAADDAPNVPQSLFPMLVRVKRSDCPRCDISTIDEASEGPPPELTFSDAMYAFNPEGSLSFGCTEILTAVEVVHETDPVLSSQRIISLATPNGHIVVGERRKRSVDGMAVQETAVEGEEEWLRHAGAVFSLPLLSTAQLRAKMPSVKARTNSFKGALSGSQDTAMQNAKNMGTIDAKAIAVGGAGQGGGLGLNAPGFNVKVKHFAGGVGAKKGIEVETAVKAAWQQVVDDADPLTWIYCDYSPDGKGLVLASSGTGGLNEFKGALGDHIAWGGFRCYAVDQRGNLTCQRPKYVFVQYKPEVAPAMKKARQGAHKGDVKEALCGAHIDVTVETMADLDEQRLIEKMQAATGAHKPNGYSFNEGVVLDADFYGLGIGRECKGETSTN